MILMFHLTPSLVIKMLFRLHSFIHLPKLCKMMHWFLRVYNVGLFLLSYILSLLIKKPVVWNYPVVMSIEPVSFCNLRCRQCPLGMQQFSRGEHSISFDVYCRIITEATPYLAYLQLFFQGEPYLHPHLFEMISFAHKKGVITSTSTNAQFLSSEMARKTVDSGLDKIIISADGATQETYMAYRQGGDFYKVINGVKHLVYWKNSLHSKTPFIVFQFLVLKSNQHEINRIKELGKELGVDKVELKTAQFYNYEKGNPQMTTLDAYCRYERQPDGNYRIKSRLPNRCTRVWSTMVVTAEADVVACCFDKNGQFVIGNLTQEQVIDVWKCRNFNSFRKNILKSRKSIDICTNCTEGLNVH